jgi:hypothetical protein
MAVFNNTQVFFNATIKEPVIVSYNITSGSLAIEVDVGGTWVPADAAYTASGVKAIDCLGVKFRVNVTGTVTYDVSNLNPVA